MTRRRLDQLLEKELDGELTAVEQDELARLILLDPLRRRERDAWARVTGSIKAPDVPRLETARMTARVLNGRSRALVQRSWWPRMLIAASGVAAIAMVVIASRHHEAVPARAVVAPVVRAPVDVFVDEESGDEDRAALVEIRF